MHRRSSQRSGNRPSENHTAGHTSIYGGAAFAMTIAIPFVLTIAYGGVDVWALIPLSLLTMTTAVLWAVDSLKAGAARFSTSPLQLPIAGLLALALLQLLPFGAAGDPANVSASAALSMDPSATAYFAIRLLLLSVFFALLLSFLNGDKRLGRVLFAVVVFGAIMAFIGILQRLTSPDAIYGMRPTPQAIPFGPFVNQHHFAAFMELTIGPTLAMILSPSTGPDKKPLYFIALVLMSSAAVMTGSRGGLIGCFVVVSVVLGLSYFFRKSSNADVGRSRIGWPIIAGAGFTLVVIVVLVVFLGGADPLVRGIGLQPGQSDPTSGRMHFWSVAWKMFLDHPIIGAGFDAFGVAFTKYDTWNGYFRVEQAHNDYLQMLADGGVLAFACVVAFIFFFLTRSLRQINSKDQKRTAIAIGAVAGCCGILVHSLFDFPLRTPSNSYFFLLLAALATVEVGRSTAGARRRK